MTDWYRRQFGDPDDFAVIVSLGRDPHPVGSAALDATWGGLALWARGRCLTRSTSPESGVGEEVRWNLLGVLQWLARASVRMLNEEPFPLSTRADHVRDGCDWLNHTETPALTLGHQEEQSWFLTRSEWSEHHALHRAAVDVALPNVVIRRLGDLLELSWDNESWGTGRSDLTFIEPRGTSYVDAAKAAEAIQQALTVVTEELAGRHAVPELVELARAAKTLRAGPGDWKWLVHRQTAAVLPAELEARLEHHAEEQSRGLFVPHTAETLVLRHSRLTTASDVAAVLAAAEVRTEARLTETLRALMKREPAPTVKPWTAGYERALDVREHLGWDDEPVPLEGWMSAQGIVHSEPELSSSIGVIAARRGDEHAIAAVNRRSESSLRRETGQGAALGHLLMDVEEVAIDGTWEHWPTAARARAFAIMLLLPEGGVHDALAGRSRVDADDVRRVMQRFGTGPYATTYHLKNLGWLDDERRTEVLAELTRT